MMKKIIFSICILVIGIIYINGKFKVSNIDKNVIAKSTVNKQIECEINTKVKNGESDLFFNKPEKPLQNANIKIYKEKRRLELYDGTNLIGRFKTALGGNPVGHKLKEGDKKTPEGKYYICTRTKQTKYTLFMGISYPNTEDAKSAFEKGIIDESTFNKIKKAQNNKTLPDWNTPLGGAVGIHGGGNSRDWTWGCIAVSDDDIRTLWEYTKLGTPVEIFK